MASETKAGKAQDKDNGAEDKEPTGEYRKSCSRRRGVSRAELGHFRRDWPNGQRGALGRNSCVVSQCPFQRAINRTFMVGPKHNCHSRWRRNLGKSEPRGHCSRGRSHWQLCIQPAEAALGVVGDATTSPTRIPDLQSAGLLASAAFLCRAPQKLGTAWHSSHSQPT